MKKTIIALMAILSVGALSNELSHNRYQGSVENFKGNIKGEENIQDLIKYSSVPVQIKLKKAAEDGVITAKELQESGITDHHFYTGYLAGATTQSDYDKRLKDLNGGKNADDFLVSNRDLKAHGSMIMNQVDAGNKIQDARVDKIVAGLHDLGNHLQAQVPTLPEQNNGGEIVHVENKYDDTKIKNAIKLNAWKINQQEQQISQNKAEIQKTNIAVRNNAEKIKDVQQESRAGIAGVAAMSSIDFKNLKPGEVGVGAGVGSYKSEQAVALGLGYAHSEYVSFSGRMSVGNDVVMGAGAVWKFKGTRR